VTIDLRPYRPLLVLLALLPTALMVVFILRGEAADDRRRGGVRATAPAVARQEVSAAESLFRERNLARALAALRARIPARQKLLKVSVRESVVEFHLREGNGATGFAWPAGERRLRPIQVRILGDGPLEGEEFPLEQVRAGVPARLAARVRDEDGALLAEVMDLERVAPDGYLQWGILARRPGGTAAFSARADGRGFADPEVFTRRRLSR
jgi:hypothetical protein